MKMRGLGAAVLVALAGLLAIAAVAPAAEFTADEYPATIGGVQGDKCTPPVPPLPPGTGGGGGGGGGSGECESSVPNTVFGFESKLMASCNETGFVGTLAKPSSALTATPVLAQCSAFGILGVTMSANGCQYVFHVEGKEAPFPGKIDIVCPTGKTIVVQSSTCEIQIGSQSNLAGIYYENLAEAPPKVPKPSMVIGFGVSEVAYTKTKDGFTCPLSGTGVKTDGVIAGGSYVVAENSEEAPIGFGVE